MHDSRVYRISSRKTWVDSLENHFVLVDPAFIGLNNIKVTYSTTFSPLTTRDAYELGRKRVIVENAFGLLKGKFNRLKTPIVNGENRKGINIVKSTIWLYNFLINNP